MPRDDDDDQSPRRTRPNSGEGSDTRKRGGLLPCWVAIAGVAVGGVLGLGVGFAGGYVAGRSAKAPAAAVASPDAAKVGEATATPKRYGRDEFRKLVTGKQHSEVLSLIGKPEKTRPYHDDGRAIEEETWVYRALTTDPVSGAADARVTLTFGQSNPISVRDVRFD